MMSSGEQYAWQVLVGHFGDDQVNGLSSSRRRFASHLLPDLQSAIVDEIGFFAPDLLGVHQAYDFQAPSVSNLLVRHENRAASITPLQYQDMDVGEDEPFAALNCGLWLFRIEGVPFAVLLSHYEDHFGREKIAQVEIAYLPAEASARFARLFLESIQKAGETSRLYRGKVLSFESGSDYSGMKADMLVHNLPKVARAEVVLDQATMDRIDQHVIEFDRHRGELKRLGQSTRKGILLYGLPGTGKTHVIRYISSTLSDHTTVLVTAEQMRNLTRYMTLARTLQPSIVVLEDVDLVGRSREATSGAAEALLNSLLNEMDGLRPDADILFILTTNRPDDIEDALASRPGRVDEAIEIPLPDEACRERLIGLYGGALSFDEGVVAEAVSRSASASAAFMKEMVRRLAQRSLARDGGGVVGIDDVAFVFGDAVDASNRIRRRLVGMNGEPKAKRALPADCCD